jgi:hypothetical protein
MGIPNYPLVHIMLEIFELQFRIHVEKIFFNKWDKYIVFTKVNIKFYPFKNMSMSHMICSFIFKIQYQKPSNTCKLPKLTLLVFVVLGLLFWHNWPCFHLFYLLKKLVWWCTKIGSHVCTKDGMEILVLCFSPIPCT